MLRDHCIFCWREKEGRVWFNIIHVKLYQFERTTWWCMYVLDHVLEFLGICHAGKNINFFMVSRNLHQAHLLEPYP